MTLGGDTVPYAGVRAGDDFHLVDYPCPVRLLGEVHSQVSTVGIDGCKQQMYMQIDYFSCTGGDNAISSTLKRVVQLLHEIFPVHIKYLKMKI